MRWNNALNNKQTYLDELILISHRTKRGFNFLHLFRKLGIWIEHVDHLANLGFWDTDAEFS
jgi:hypothetical protein